MPKAHRTSLTGADETVLAGTGRFVRLRGPDQVHRGEDEPVHHPTEPFRHGDGSAEQSPTHRLNRSIRPGVPTPATVLVAEMHGGSLLLQGWRDGPSAYASADDAVPLRHALAAAYGSEVRHRILRERLKRVVATAEQERGDEWWRLALLCLALLDRHRVDNKGRCRCCRTPRGWWRRRSQRCMVLSTVSFYLEQPREFLSTLDA